MFVKKFEAPSLEQALAMVKGEFGPNALILSTAEKKGKWFQKPQVEVTAASERKDEKPAKDADFDENALKDLFPHRRYDGYGNHGGGSAGRLSAIPSPGKNTQRYIDMDPLPAPNRSTSTGAKPVDLTSLEQGFLSAGISVEVARELTRAMKDDYSKKEMVQPGFVEKAKGRALAAHLKTVTPDMIQNRTEWTAVGSPGSGKTSFLVKLALYLKKRRGPVSLVGADTRKVFGKNEMAAYARLIKVPFNADAHRNSASLSLIDSPALGVAVDTSLRVLCEGRSVFLVLDASTRLSEMLRVVERAQVLNPMAVAFTRLDLVGQYGVIFDLLKTTKLPLLAASRSASFKDELKFFEPTELANLILKQRGIDD